MTAVPDAHADDDGAAHQPRLPRTGCRNPPPREPRRTARCTARIHQAHPGVRRHHSSAAPVAVAPTEADKSDDGDDSQPVPGYVNLLRSGKHHKIGRSNDHGRRAYELGLQLPEKLEMVHTIETDDAVGIEHSWHERLWDRRRNGEWFTLTRGDVAAFKRLRSVHVGSRSTDVATGSTVDSRNGASYGCQNG